MFNVVPLFAHKIKSFDACKALNLKPCTIYITSVWFSFHFKYNKNNKCKTWFWYLSLLITIIIIIQSDTYLTGCYNLQCPGFIQTSENIIIGGAIAPVSEFNANQFEITISV